MISVVIPARNEEKNIGNIIKSIKECGYKKPYEIIVVDGNSTDRTREIAKSMDARVILQKGRLGVSNARNLGWKNARGNIIVFVEADHIVKKGFLDEIDKTFRNPVDAARYNIKPLTKNFIQKILKVQIELASRRQRVWLFPTIFRKYVLKKTGGYDEKLGFAEDRDLPMRVYKRGFNVVFIKNAKIHAKPVDSFVKLWKEGMWYGKNMLPYVKKHKDYTILLSVLTYSLALPFLILGTLQKIFLLVSCFLFLLMFSRSVQGFVYTKSLYAFLLPLIWIVRGTGELIGLLLSPLKRHKGK
ncbi:MAG: glycosyltransferase [Candidatus Aenigmarchaeota archaeon]|nr:glycosyltransferase [Candidatus Aenigmarchaeota archaeon]